MSRLPKPVSFAIGKRKLLGTESLLVLKPSSYFLWNHYVIGLHSSIAHPAWIVRAILVNGQVVGRKLIFPWLSYTGHKPIDMYNSHNLRYAILVWEWEVFINRKAKVDKKTRSSKKIVKFFAIKGFWFNQWAQKNQWKRLSTLDRFIRRINFIQDDFSTKCYMFIEKSSLNMIL